MKKTAILSTLAFAAVAITPLTAAAEPPGEASELLRNAVTVDGIRAHQQAFQDIADANGGIRAASTPGYDLSADYVQGLLEDAGYTVERPTFDFNFFDELGVPTFAQTSPTPTTYVDQVDFDVMRFSAPGTVSAAVTPVDLSLADRDASTSGCEPEDFDGFAAGTVALVQRGACTFALKAQNAEAAGAVATIVFNQGNTPDREGVVLGTLGAPGIGIPVIGTTFAIGEEFAAGGVEVDLAVDTISEVRSTTNVIATSQTGDPDTIVMAGAHLDSVPEGPGIQDNGSGSAAILEIALQLASDFGVNDPGDDSLTNKVRFAWWGAEEGGLNGSIDYVVNLSGEELAKIAVYQNFDMIGSPNFVRFVYDGDGSDIAPSIFVPAASAVLEQTFLDYFDGQGLPTEATIIGQRSDHFAFCVSGVPCGGLFTGAEGIKTAEQVAIYGGTEGDQYDPCYHLACDTFDNISLEALDQMSDAAAHAVATYAFSALCGGIPATIVGTDGPDVLTGTPGDDVIASLGGNDLVRGMGGNDTICTGDGNDKAFGGSGNDTIDGGEGRDNLRGTSGDDTILGGGGNDVIEGDTGNDTIDGGDGNDKIKGRSGLDTIEGGGGDDIVAAGSGNDVVSGGDGDDRLMGQVGDDTLDGGDGFDRLRGDAGTDTCTTGEIVQTCEAP